MECRKWERNGAKSVLFLFCCSKDKAGQENWSKEYPYIFSGTEGFTVEIVKDEATEENHLKINANYSDSLFPTLPVQPIEETGIQGDFNPSINATDLDNDLYDIVYNTNEGSLPSGAAIITFVDDKGTVDTSDDVICNEKLQISIVNGKVEYEKILE